MDIKKKPTPLATPLYPDPDAPKVPTGLQGPNEQSIVASGMTVEEWQRKHPRQVLGPTPEDVGQVTTDPPDGSELEPPYPGTGTSVDPEGGLSVSPNADYAGEERQGEALEQLEPVGGTSVEPQPIPVPPDPEPFRALDADEVAPGEEGEGAEDDSQPWDSMSRHNEIDDWARENGVQTPEDWPGMTIQQKRRFLGENY